MLKAPRVRVYSSMLLKNNPRISVCIPNYNRAHNLREVLMDCLNQTSKPFEILVQDDSFLSSEIKKIDRVISKFENIKFSRNQKNLGLAKNVNRVISKAKGDVVVIVNNDDRISTKYIEEIQKSIKTYPQFNIYTTNACAITDDGSVFGDYRLYPKNTVIKARKGIANLWEDYFLNLISVSGATIYKRQYIQKHLFNIEYGNEADLDNALSILSTQNIMYLNLPIYYVRMNRANTSIEVRSTAERLERHINKCLTIYEKYHACFKDTPLYMVRPKSVYFLQLLFKYRYSLSKIKSMLRLGRWSELYPILELIPSFIMAQSKQRILFQFYKDSYKKYYPLNYNA